MRKSLPSKFTKFSLGRFGDSAVNDVDKFDSLLNASLVLERRFLLTQQQQQN